MRQNQHLRASGNGKSTLYRKGRDPPNVSLGYIAVDLITYFTRFSLFQHYEKEIEKKYDIKKENDGCWSADDIKRVWGKTQRMYEPSKRRKCWSLAVIVQMMKKYARYDDDSERLKAESDEVHPIRAGGETQKKRGEEPEDINIRVNPPKEDHLSNGGTIYIRVPFSEMFGHKSSFSPDPSAPMEPVSYKLKDKVPSLTKIQKKTSYVMQNDNRTRNAAWVYEILNESIVQKNDENKKRINRAPFKVDPSIPKDFQTRKSLKSYKNTGYDRGHLAPARNHKCSKEAQVDASLLSNITPQIKKFNNGIWRTLENRCVEIAEKKDVRNVHVYTGPLYIPHNNEKQHEEGNKVVPTHFFKVIIEEKEDGRVKKPKCYMIPNVKQDKKGKKENKNWLILSRILSLSRECLV